MSSTTEAAAPAIAPPVPDAAPGPTLAGSRESGTGTATRDAAVFTGANYVANGLQFVAGLLQKAILGPTLTGYWQLMQTFWTFFSVAPLGAQHGATRQIPAHRGRGDYAAAEEASSTAATFSLGAMAVFGTLVAAVAVVFGGGWADELRYGLVLLGLTAPLRYLVDAFQVILQSVRRFGSASLALVVMAVLAVTAQTAAVYLLGFYGLFAGLVLMQLGAIAMWVKTGAITRARPAFRLRVDRSRLRELIRFGAPILVTGQVWLVFQAVDSLIVAGALGVKQLGYYGLAVSVTSYIQYLPKSISATLFPRMMERFAQTGEISSIRRYAIDVQRLMAFVLAPLAVGVGFFGFPVLIDHGLPAFKPAIGVVEIMVAASFFMALMNMPTKVLVTAGYRWRVTALTGICLVVNAVANYVAVNVLDAGIEGAAFATAASYLFTLLLTSGYALSKMLAASEVVLHLAEIVAAFAWTYLALRITNAAIGSSRLDLVPETGIAIAKLAAFLLLMTPLAVLAEKRVRGITMILDVARRALPRRSRPAGG